MSPIARQAFVFFEDSRNLFEIARDWLDFRMADYSSMNPVHEGAEFDYTIHWHSSLSLPHHELAAFFPHTA